MTAVRIADLEVGDQIRRYVSDDVRTVVSIEESDTCTCCRRVVLGNGRRETAHKISRKGVWIRA